jgi:tetrathionate reductase subunit B
MKRRDFLGVTGAALLGPTCAQALRLLPSAATGADEGAAPKPVPRWGMVIDLRKCPADCDDCLRACRTENNVPFYGDKRWDIHWIRKVTVKSKDPGHPFEKSVPLLCNQCDKPPCALVCPVQATYKREDGIVIVDQHRCIGCRYCVIACPYNARYFNFKENEEWPNKNYPKRSHGVAESCNFCAHRLDEGRQPACVEACAKKTGALRVGNLDDPQSEVSKLIAGNSVKRIRADLGTEPKVFYIGL